MKTVLTLFVLFACAVALRPAAALAQTITITASGPLTFPCGDSVILMAPAGYKKYSWNDGTTTQNDTLNYSGDFYVIATESGGKLDTSNTLSTNDTGSLSPVITGSDRLCHGDTITLDAGAGYDSYTWNDGEFTQKIMVTDSFLYNVSVTKGSCSGKSPNFQVKFYPPDSIQYSFNNQTAVITVMPSLPTQSCQWYWDNHILPGDTTLVYQATKNGTYTLKLIDENGCKSSFSLSVSGLAVDEQTTTSMATSLAQNYPNPFSDETTIAITLAARDVANAHLGIYNMLGEKIADLTPQLTPQAAIPFSGAGLAPGTYYCLLKTPAHTFARLMFIVR
jgi:hypothetical protein